MLTRYRNSVRTKRRYRFVTLMQEVCAFVGWSEMVGGGDLWWEAVGREAGCVGQCGDWKRGMWTNGGQDDVVGDGRDAG